MNSSALAWRSLVETASAPYARTSRLARHVARGKLRWDPVFRHLIGSGLIAPRSRVLDIGCGRGLLASLLNAANVEARRGRWPADWSQAPLDVHVTGIDIAARDVVCAREALGASADFVCADIRLAAFPAADAVVLLDVLHYLSIAEQDEVLARVRSALGRGGRLVLRVGDAASRRGFMASQCVDRIVTIARRQHLPRRAGRTLAQWRARLVALGFDVSSQPMHRGTPFANVLLVGTIASMPAPGP